MKFSFENIGWWNFPSKIHVDEIFFQNAGRWHLLQKYMLMKFFFKITGCDEIFLQNYRLWWNFLQKTDCNESSFINTHVEDITFKNTCWMKFFFKIQVDDMAFKKYRYVTRHFLKNTDWWNFPSKNAGYIMTFTSKLHVDNISFKKTDCNESSLTFINTCWRYFLQKYMLDEIFLSNTGWWHGLKNIGNIS